MQEYHKLVRDNIPDIITESGRSCRVRRAGNDETFSLLLDKIIEETGELRTKPCREELADILEAAYAIAEKKGWSLEEIEKLRIEKQKKRGGYKDNVVLLYTE